MAPRQPRNPVTMTMVPRVMTRLAADSEGKAGDSVAKLPCDTDSHTPTPRSPQPPSCEGGATQRESASLVTPPCQVTWEWEGPLRSMLDRSAYQPTPVDCTVLYCSNWQADLSTVPLGEDSHLWSRGGHSIQQVCSPRWGCLNQPPNTHTNSIISIYFNVKSLRLPRRVSWTRTNIVMFIDVVRSHDYHNNNMFSTSSSPRLTAWVFSSRIMYWRYIQCPVLTQKSRLKRKSMYLTQQMHPRAMAGGSLGRFCKIKVVGALTLKCPDCDPSNSRTFTLKLWLCIIMCFDATDNHIIIMYNTTYTE